MSSVSFPSQTLVVNVVQSSNPKENQQFDGKRKGHGKKKYKGGKGNVNKPSDYTSEGKESKNKVKFPCKLCSGDNITQICANIQYSQQLLAHQGSSCPKI